jgi:ergothioneine biosynthesis protein EgtB
MTSALLTAPAVRERLEAAWERSDALFATLRDEALGERPIRLRQPFVFYLGHLPAFAWNHIGRRRLGRPAGNAAFDDLFARGIDPPDTSDAPSEAGAWPDVAAVRDYRDRIRAALRPVLDEPRLEATALMVVEHELMHHETLLYMVLRLDHAKKKPPRTAQTPASSTGAGRLVRIPAGRARLGTARDSLRFGWDNEFPQCEVDVEAFSIDAVPVRNRDFLEFVESGAYADENLWSEEAWQWLQRDGRRYPPFWQETKAGLTVRNAYADVPLDLAGEWPVFVTWAEASAYARQHGRRLPTEAEWDRAAFGTPDGSSRFFPWGNEPASAARGNFGLRHWSPQPVGAHPRGASAFGVLDLAGSGWDWTSTPFAPFAGFEPLEGYEGYSADFFDDRHYVLKGASWATDDSLVRRSFRNWFQPHYPHVFAQFRLLTA